MRITITEHVLRWSTPISSERCVHRLLITNHDNLLAPRSRRYRLLKRGTLIFIFRNTADD